MNYLKKSVAGTGLFLLMGLLMLGFSGCNDDDGEVIDDILGDQDRDFAVDAAYGNRAEIELGQLAADRSNDFSIQSFGEQMELEHTQAQEDLMDITASKNVVLPDTMNAEHQMLYDELSALEGYQFDSAYIHNQVLAHEETVDLYQTQIDEGEDDDFIGYADNLLPDINLHLEEANDIWDELINGDN